MKKYKYLEIDNILINLFRRFVINNHIEVVVDDIDINYNLDNLQLDSLDLVEIVMDIEKTFDIAMEDIYVEEKFSYITNIKYIKDLLREDFSIYDICEVRKDKINNIIRT